MGLSWYLMELLALTGQDPRVIALGEEYVRAAVWVVPPSLGFVALRSFVVGVSRPLVITVLTVLTLPLNALFTYALVFGALGMPALGVAGAGYATSLVGWLTFVALVAYIGRHAMLREYHVFRGLMSFDHALRRRIWRLGLPVAGMTVVEGTQFQVMTLLVGLFGAVTLAAHQVVVNAVSLGFMIALGLADAAAVRVSQEMGAERPHAARRAGWIAIAGGALIGLGSAVVLWLTPELVAGVFLDLSDPANAEILEIVPVLATVGAAMAIVDLVLIVVSRCLRGLEDTVVPMVITGGRRLGGGDAAGSAAGVRLRDGRGGTVVGARARSRGNRRSDALALAGPRAPRLTRTWRQAEITTRAMRGTRASPASSAHRCGCRCGPRRE